MSVVLARTDNRLVHGQVLEAWVPAVRADTILVVDRRLIDDAFQCTVIEGLARSGLDIRVVTPEQALILLGGELKPHRVALLFAGVDEALEALDAGVVFDTLNLGNVHPREGARAVTVSVYLTSADASTLGEISSRGVAIEARAVPSDRSPDVLGGLGGLG